MVLRSPTREPRLYFGRRFCRFVSPDDKSRSFVFSLQRFLFAACTLRAAFAYTYDYTWINISVNHQISWAFFDQKMVWSEDTSNGKKTLLFLDGIHDSRCEKKLLRPNATNSIYFSNLALRKIDLARTWVCSHATRTNLVCSFTEISSMRMYILCVRIGLSSNRFPSSVLARGPSFFQDPCESVTLRRWKRRRAGKTIKVNVREDKPSRTKRTKRRHERTLTCTYVSIYVFEIYKS